VTDTEQLPRLSCLQGAADAVVDRAASYGKPHLLFTRIAKRWSLTLGIEVTARQVAMLMIDMKQERAIAGLKGDSAIDIAGYAACLYEIDALIGAPATAVNKGE
jgi:uncharacterized protein DUF6378